MTKNIGRQVVTNLEDSGGVQFQTVFAPGCHFKPVDANKVQILINIFLTSNINVDA